MLSDQLIDQYCNQQPGFEVDWDVSLAALTTEYLEAAQYCSFDQ